MRIRVYIIAQTYLSKYLGKNTVRSFLCYWHTCFARWSDRFYLIDPINFALPNASWILFLFFLLVLWVQRLPRLGKRELIFVLFVRLFDLRLFGVCLFPLPLGVWEGLRFVTVALPGLFSYLFFLYRHVFVMTRERPSGLLSWKPVSWKGVYSNIKEIFFSSELDQILYF